MLILGIESSCDETSVALLDGNKVLKNIVASQELHIEYGGVVPEFASREHIKNIQIITENLFRDVNKKVEDIDAIAVTRGPGLMGALLVGLSFAKGLAYTLKKPLMAVNHVEGHIMANFLDHDNLDYPFLCLLVSGGHTQIVYVEEFGKYEILGKSVDDAAGEAFDKAARILHLGYPGGPLIDKTAVGGNRKFHHFPRAKVKSEKSDFSFSGLKTSILYLVKRKGIEWAKENIIDLCASYQEAIVDVLQKSCFSLAQQKGIDTIVLAGGVAANSRLREVFAKKADEKGYNIFFPSIEYCTDNAAMIARAGLEMFKRDQTASLKISAIPNLVLK